MGQRKNRSAGLVRRTDRAAEATLDKPPSSETASKGETERGQQIKLWLFEWALGSSLCFIFARFDNSAQAAKA